jgi:hypothetical protein
LRVALRHRDTCTAHVSIDATQLLLLLLLLLPLVVLLLPGPPHIAQLCSAIDGRPEYVGTYTFPVFLHATPATSAALLLLLLLLHSCSSAAPLAGVPNTPKPTPLQKTRCSGRIRQA